MSSRVLQCPVVYGLLVPAKKQDLRHAMVSEIDVEAIERKRARGFEKEEEEEEEEEVGEFINQNPDGGVTN